jgi:glycosyltransferase involved in cell wall biosynthesis
MKLIVQIPCFNEEDTLPQTVADIPRHVEGVDKVELLIIDDGSSDGTVEVARNLGVHHIVENKINMGLARSFRRGLDACLHLGADIIVNTDGDNQYAGEDVEKLVKALIDKKADIVIGDRKTSDIVHFSRSKKLMQWFGSGVVRKLAGIWVPDTVSGFRAFSRDAAIRINVVSPFSYTIETVIQAGKKDMLVVSVPVGTNPQTRDSRLFKSIPSFINRQVSTIVRMYSMYQPLKVFISIGIILSAVGIIPVFRFLWFYLLGDSTGHIQSLILGGVLLMMGFFTFMVGMLADLISFNRQLIEMALEKVRRLELEEPSSYQDKGK